MRVQERFFLRREFWGEGIFRHHFRFLYHFILDSDFEFWKNSLTQINCTIYLYNYFIPDKNLLLVMNEDLDLNQHNKWIVHQKECCEVCGKNFCSDKMKWES